MFGTMSPLVHTNLTTRANMSVTCNWGPYSQVPGLFVCLKLGASAVTRQVVPRALTSGKSRVLYNLYSDAQYSTVWGSDAFSEAPPITLFLQNPSHEKGGSTTQFFTVYGKIPARQTTAQGSNSSTTMHAENFNGGNAVMLYGQQDNCMSPMDRRNFSFAVSVNVINNCEINGTEMHFGTEGALTHILTATSILSIECTNNTAYQVSLNGGATSGNVANRQMQGLIPANKVNYQLYTTNNHDVVWGDGQHGSSTVAGTGNGTIQMLTVYGSVPIQPTPAPGAYQDIITATVSF